MTPEQRQATAVAVILPLESRGGHEDRCGARNDRDCGCYLRRNAETRAAALDDAGLLCALVEVQS